MNCWSDPKVKSSVINNQKIYLRKIIVTIYELSEKPFFKYVTNLFVYWKLSSNWPQKLKKYFLVAHMLLKSVKKLIFLE